MKIITIHKGYAVFIFIKAFCQIQSCKTTSYYHYIFHNGKYT